MIYSFIIYYVSFFLIREGQRATTAIHDDTNDVMCPTFNT